MRVLDVGSGGTDACRRVMGPEAEIVTLDANAATGPDIVADITRDLPDEIAGAFDVVFASHVLEHIERKDVLPVVRRLAKLVRPGGELWLIVPALEWAAREILFHPNPSNALQAHIFGSQADEWQYHKSGYTLKILRDVAALAGLYPTQAYSTPLNVILGDRTFVSEQNVVVARKPVAAPEMPEA